MLTEFQNVKQYPGERFRRWFQDDYFDVIIWLEEDRKDVFGFQLCYDVQGDEHCLTWKKDSGFRHEVVDEGDSATDVKMSPIQLPDGPFPYKKVLDHFLDSFPSTDKKLMFFVYDKVIEYTNSGGKLI
jgi:hypothetical protein